MHCFMKFGEFHQNVASTGIGAYAPEPRGRVAMLNQGAPAVGWGGFSTPFPPPSPPLLSNKEAPSYIMVRKAFIQFRLRQISGGLHDGGKTQHV